MCQMNTKQSNKKSIIGYRFYKISKFGGAICSLYGETLMPPIGERTECITDPYNPWGWYIFTNIDQVKRYLRYIDRGVMFDAYHDNRLKVYKVKLEENIHTGQWKNLTTPNSECESSYDREFIVNSATGKFLTIINEVGLFHPVIGEVKCVS